MFQPNHAVQINTWNLLLTYATSLPRRLSKILKSSFSRTLKHIWEITPYALNTLT